MLPTSQNILIVEDETLFRHFICQHLRQTYPEAKLYEATSGQDALDIVDSVVVHFCVLDLRLPGLDGLTVAGSMLKAQPNMRILVISASDDQQLVKELLLMGVLGYLHKTDDFESFHKSIELVISGRGYISMPRVQDERPISPNSRSPLLDELTTRERQVLSLLARGYTNKKMAAHLAISIKTVEAHRAKLARKLKIHDIAGLALFAAQQGLLEEALPIPADEIEVDDVV